MQWRQRLFRIELSPGRGRDPAALEEAGDIAEKKKRPLRGVSTAVPWPCSPRGDSSRSCTAFRIEKRSGLLRSLQRSNGVLQRGEVGLGVRNHLLGVVPPEDATD